MTFYKAITLMGIITILSGCKPTIVVSENSENVETVEEIETRTEQSSQSLPIQASQKTSDKSGDTQTTTAQGETVKDPPLSAAEITGNNTADSKIHTFALIAGPWQKYLRSAPEIYAVSSMSSDVKNLISEEQRLIKSVIEADVSVNETSDYLALEERLDELQTSIPSAETRSGYVQSSRRYYRRTYVSGGTIYTNSYPYYSYRVFREKAKSSSPELVRSVQSIATNATLEDLDQRIDALQHFIAQWKRKISLMSSNGTEGIMREANTAYIEGLEDYTREFIKLNASLRKIEEAQEAKKAEKRVILDDWNLFEATSLEIIRRYFEDSSLDVISAFDGLNYRLTEAQLEKSLILACEIGTQTVYFEIDGRNPNHPFILADITPATE